MLPKKHRLSKHAEVTTTTARGRSFFSQSFIIKFLANPKLALPKVTTIASAKVSKSAVVRNRLKRVVRHAIAEHVGKIKSGQYVIILKRSAITKTGRELAEEVSLALKKSKIIT